MSDTSGADIEDLIEGARTLGSGDPEEEITALQDLLRNCWALMTERQQAELIESDEAQALLNPDVDESEDSNED